MQLILVLAIVLLLLVFGDISVTIHFWLASAAVFVVACAINLLLLKVINAPLREIIAALSRASGERSPLLPSNPNQKSIERIGLKPVLDMVHSLAADGGEEKKQDDSPETTSYNTEESLLRSSTGIAMFDADGKLIFHNDAVPTHKNPDGLTTLDVQFYTDTSIEAWIQECEQKTVHAEKTWVRVASKPAGEEGRKLYDIVASYQKGASAPVVAVFVEKSPEYTPEEDDLNFIAFAAHELRGPITVIRGYLDTLVDELDGEIDPEQRELFDRLIVSANRLASYINNILNSARYDQRHLSVNLIETTVGDIYGIIADDMQLRASSQHRLLSVDLPVDLPTIAADPGSASEVFGNLIDNALKYSNEGGAVSVTAEVQGNFVEVSVKDNGIGMPPNVVANLFHKFYRSHRSRETVAGTGIGLYISKGIVESHGGTMEARSIEGEGSTFSFTLPIYASVADKIAKNDGNNQALIRNHSGGWIRNHGQLRG